MIYNSIKSTLNVLAWIKWVDCDSGQLESAEKRKSLKYPCALISSTSQFSNIVEDGSIQREDIMLTIRLAWDGTGQRTNALAPESVQVRAELYTLQTVEAYELLQAISIDDYDAFECISGTQDNRTDGVISYRFVFKTGRLKVK